MVNKKNAHILLLLFFLLGFSCVSVKQNEKNIEVRNYKEGLNFEIPSDMYDSTRDAKKYSFQNFLIKKGESFVSSDLIVAIREVTNSNKQTLKVFTDIDQNRLKSYYDIKYLSKWQPNSFLEKKIEFLSFYFSYLTGGNIIYQQSVYIRFKDRFYIISLMTKNQEILKKEKALFFWNSVFLQY